MMILSGLMLALSLTFALVHIFLGGQFVRRILNRSVAPVPDADCPPALVVLCIRGADPFLERSLTSLFHQDYPAYEVRIVVDSTSDPGWEMVHALIRESAVEHVRVQPLTQRRGNCSLKCSSQLQSLEDLQPHHQLLAFLDADTVPHATWLRELAGGLRDPKVGAATGGRWYMPVSPSVGAVVRVLWNVPAQVIMTLVNIAWGGTLAFRRADFDRMRLVERWGEALCEDCMTADVLREHGFKVQFVPSLLMANREDIRLGNFFRWISRQLVFVRLYHSFWWFVLSHGLLVFAVVYGGSALALLAALTGDPNAMWMALLGVVVFQATMISLFVWLQWAVRDVLSHRGESPTWGNLRTWLSVPVLIVIAQAVNCGALLRAQFSTSIEWRGIIYKIKSPFAIQIVSENQMPTTRTHSL